MSKAINIDSLSKKYFIGIKKDDTFRGAISKFLSSTNKGEEYLALDNISLDIFRGEALAIIGKNGAGKSTLLKILSKITSPSDGKITIEGRVASLLEVGTGFHPELTGRENIFLNGTLLGMSRKQIKTRFDDIVDFSGVGKFIDTPVKHYSSGMYVRLAFSVAAYLEPEILIIDEVLAVGDAEFQDKCLGKMKDVSSSGRTVIFVSHNMAAVRTLCNRAVVIDSGKLVFDGKPSEAIDFYQNSHIQNSHFKIEENEENLYSNEYVRIEEFYVQPMFGESLIISSGLEFTLVFQNKVEGINLDVTFEVKNTDDLIIFHHGTILTENNDSKLGKYVIKGSIESLMLNAGKYRFNIVFGRSQRTRLLKVFNIVEFEILNESFIKNFQKLPGIIRPKIQYTKDFFKH